MEFSEIVFYVKLSLIWLKIGLIRSDSLIRKSLLLKKKFLEYKEPI